MNEWHPLLIPSLLNMCWSSFLGLVGGGGNLIIGLLGMEPKKMYIIVSDRKQSFRQKEKCWLSFSRSVENSDMSKMICALSYPMTHFSLQPHPE